MYLFLSLWPTVSTACAVKMFSAERIIHFVADLLVFSLTAHVCVCVSVFFSCIPEILELEFIGLWVSIATLSAQATLMFFFFGAMLREVQSHLRVAHRIRNVPQQLHIAGIYTHMRVNT